MTLKVHKLPQGSVERQESFQKHAIREYQIQKELVHDNIVSLHEAFGVSKEEFCTVFAASPHSHHCPNTI
jgi:hypothetical protein